MAVKRWWLRFSLAAVVLAALASAAAPALASAGTITGTVTEAAGLHAPLDGVEVCWHKNPYTAEDVCTSTDAGGHYALTAASGTYSIRFRDQPRNRNFIDQYYGGSLADPGTYVTVADPDETVTGVDAQLVEGSTISGTVTDAGSAAALAGIPVCAGAFLPAGGFYQRCTMSGPAGSYTINGLAAGSYEVEFQSGLLNFQPQSYDGTAWPEPWTPVTIAGPGETKSGIDAAMKVGVEITGRVTEAGTGKAVQGIPIELLFVGREGNRLSFTGPNGEYRFWGQREGDHLVRFSHANGPYGFDGACFPSQYYKGSASADGATVLHGVPGIPITGIDAELVSTCPEPSSSPPPPPLQVGFAPATSQVGSTGRPIQCRKGFQRKRVKGKARCVKRHKRHRPHRQHQDN